MSQYPIITAGTRLTADLLNNMIPSYVVKPADTTRASTTTASSDPDLVTGTLIAGGVYVVEFHVKFASLQVSGIKTNWVAPSGTSGNRDVLGPAATNATNATDGVVLDMRWAVHGIGTAVAYTNPRNSIGLQTHVVEKALLTIGATPGTCAFQWAQNVSNATGTVVAASSYVKWSQVS